MQIPFGVQSKPGFDGQESTGRIINGYVEQWNGEYPASIIASSGLKDFATVTGKTRGLITSLSDLYAVSGTQVYSIGADGSSSVLGTLAGSGSVRMSVNDKTTQQIALSADDGNYIIESFTLNKVSDVDLPPSVDNVFIDGYTIWLIGDGRCFYSTLSEASDIDALDFATAEANPDGLVGGAVSGRNIWFFGPKSIEIWNNVGGATLPFQRATSYEVGCEYRDSIKTLRQSVFWIGDGVVYQASGLTPDVISSPSVNEAIREATRDGLNITACVRLERGHAFYTISCDNWSWEYDLTTGFWFERKSFGKKRWDIEHIEKFGSKLIGGGTGKLYEIDFDTYDEAGSPLITEFISQQMYSPSGERVSYYSINIDAQRGSGLNSNDAEDTDPHIMLDWTNDGGKTFKGERLIPVGKIGERTKRVRARRLGSDYKRAFRLRTSAAVAKQFFRADVNV